MHDYYVEERSGVIGFGPIASPELYYRRPSKVNWGTITAWIHLIICLLAIPLIIWNLYLLLDTITYYTQVTLTPTGDGPQLTEPQGLALTIVLSAIHMNLLGGLFALVTEAACFSDKLAKLLYIMAYLSISITIYTMVFSRALIHPLWLVVLLIFIIAFGFGFWRFSIISAIYLNEEGPVWFKPLLYGCLAAIPILTTNSQCKEAKNIQGCLPNDMFGGRYMYNDFFSFVIMTTIAILSAIPYLLGIPHTQQ